MTVTVNGAEVHVAPHLHRSTRTMLSGAFLLQTEEPRHVEVTHQLPASAGHLPKLDIDPDTFRKHRRTTLLGELHNRGDIVGIRAHERSNVLLCAKREALGLMQVHLHRPTPVHLLYQHAPPTSCVWPRYVRAALIVLMDFGDNRSERAWPRQGPPPPRRRHERGKGDAGAAGNAACSSSQPAAPELHGMS